MAGNMDNEVSQLLNDLNQIESLSADQRNSAAQRAARFAAADNERLESLLEGLLQREAPVPGSHAEALLAAFLEPLARRSRTVPTPLSPTGREQIVRLYRHLGDASGVRHLLAAALAAIRQRDDLTELVRLLLDDPPKDAKAVALVFTPLFQRPDYDPSLLFPELLDGLRHVSIAAAILDLANFLFREEIVAVHPAADRLEGLLTLLGGLAQRLGRLQEQPLPGGQQAGQLSDTVSEALCLAVSLCHALSLIGDKQAIGKLYQTLELGDRRLRCEAAAALAHLGEQAGRDALVELAAEPVARLRVLAYADELEMLDKIDEQYATPQARAEAELALHLSQPSQLGFPPGKLELVDQREQYWPSYDEPVDCFLFRFSYKIGPATYSNIGIVGPLTHAFTADLADLPPDDIYAAYAGWQVEHEEIYELPCDALSDAYRPELDRLQRRLRDEGYVDIQPLTLGFFLGDKALVASARREGIDGLAVADLRDVYWYPRGGSRPLQPTDVYNIYKGRKLLRQFNA